MLALAVPAFGSGGCWTPRRLLLWTTPGRDGFSRSDGSGSGATTPPNRRVLAADAVKPGIPGPPTKFKQIAPKGGRPLATHERLPRACLWMDGSKGNDAIQQPPDPTAGLWLTPGFLQLLSPSSCLQAVCRRTQRGPQQVTCSPPVTAPKPASDAASRLLLFSCCNRIVAIRNPIAPATCIQLDVLKARLMKSKHVRRCRNAGTAIHDDFFLA